MRLLIENYKRQFEQIWDGSLWLDETYAKKLGAITDKQAFALGPDGSHSVAQVVAHIVAWRNEVIRRLATDGPRGLNAGTPADWPENDTLRQIGWQALYQELSATQERLIALLQENDDSFLQQKMSSRQLPKDYFVAGLLHHDLYHLGQIGLFLKWA